MLVVRFLLGTIMFVSLVWLVAEPGFTSAMILAISFSGLAAAWAVPKEVSQMET